MVHSACNVYMALPSAVKHNTLRSAHATAAPTASGNAIPIEPPVLASQSWGSEIRDRGLGANQDKLTKFLQLIDRLLEDVVNPFYPGLASATLHSHERIGAKEARVCGGGDAPGCLQSLAIKSASSNE